MKHTHTQKIHTHVHENIRISLCRLHSGGKARHHTKRKETEVTVTYHIQLLIRGCKMHGRTSSIILSDEIWICIHYLRKLLWITKTNGTIKCNRRIFRNRGIPTRILTKKKKKRECHKRQCFCIRSKTIYVFTPIPSLYSIVYILIRII